MLDASDLPLIQIAGVIDEAEAHLLIDAGVRWLGFPLRLTVNKEDLSEDAARKKIEQIAREVLTNPVIEEFRFELLK